ncbi:hypothetical protein NHQ30_000768 [Ciborinia camelliae]|nr:hypothetical protein NHQ30_000768 [Ciborinia camelliae]
MLCFFGIQSNPINISKYPSTSIPVLTNFSPRFSLTNMTGKDFSSSISAANAVCDTTDGPDSVIRDESQDQVSLALARVYSLSSAQMTMSGAIYNPTDDDVIVTNIPLTPIISSTTSSIFPATTILSTPTPTISPQPVTETPKQTPIQTPIQTSIQTPIFATTAHKRIVIAVPVAIGIAAIFGLALFFLIRYRRRHTPSEKSDTDGSILPFFPPPPTHPNTWMDTTALTFKYKSNNFWYRLKAKRPRGSVAELPGYEIPGTLKHASHRNTSPSGTTCMDTSEMDHTSIAIPPTAKAGISSSTFQSSSRNLPGREVGFLAVGPDSTFTHHNSDIKTPIGATHTNHSHPRASTIKTITTESSGIPSSSVLSSSFSRERELGPSPVDFGNPLNKEREAQTPPLPPSPTALRGTAKVVTISRSNSLLHSGSGVGEIPQDSAYYPVGNVSTWKKRPDEFAFSNSSLANQTPSYQTLSSAYRSESLQTSFSPPPTSVLPAMSQPKRFRSPMGRTDESEAIREAERRIRGLLRSDGGTSPGIDGVVSPVSPVSPMSR